MVEGYRMRKKICEFIASSDCDALTTLSFIIQGTFLIIGMMLIAENLQDLIQIVFAPKIYLIEYSAKLLGR